MMNTLTTCIEDISVGDTIAEEYGEMFTVEALAVTGECFYLYGTLRTTEVGRRDRLAPIGETAQVRRIIDRYTMVELIPPTLAVVLPFRKVVK
jgi:hypothetical protein